MNQGETNQAGRWLRRLDRPENRPAVRLLLAANHAFARWYHRVRMDSPCRLPRTGPAILVCNHVSGLDPLLIQSGCPRLITWMMAREYYQVKSLRWVFRTIGAIPVERSGRDLKATREALRALEAGRVIGVFPEGRIEDSGELLPFHTGVALLAMRSGAAVYPAYLEGTQRNKEMVKAFVWPNRARLRFGEPIRLEESGGSREALKAATQRIHEAVAALREEEKAMAEKQ